MKNIYPSSKVYFEDESDGDDGNDDDDGWREEFGVKIVAEELWQKTYDLYEGVSKSLYKIKLKGNFGAKKVWNPCTVFFPPQYIFF